jgi:hypothetical protein
MKRRKISFPQDGLMTAAREGSSDATGLPPVAATPQNGPAAKADVPGGRAHAGPQPVFIHSGDNMHREVD